MSEKSEPRDLTGTIYVGTDASQRGAELRDKNGDYFENDFIEQYKKITGK